MELSNIKSARFFENMRGKKTAFIGVGVTNAPTAKFFAEMGAKVYCCDRKGRDYIGEDICCSLEKAGVKVIYINPDEYETE